MNKRTKIFLCVFTTVIVFVVGIPLVSALDNNGPPAITYNPHPCGRVATIVRQGVQLQLETDTKSLVNSRVCIHSILTNVGTSSINLNDLMANIKVVDIHGNSVYSTGCVVAMFPASLTQGQTWDCLAYWTPTLSGAYYLHVDVISASTNDALVSADAQIIAT